MVESRDRKGQQEEEMRVMMQVPQCEYLLDLGAYISGGNSSSISNSVKVKSLSCKALFMREGKR